MLLRWLNNPSILMRVGRRAVACRPEAACQWNHRLDQFINAVKVE